MIQMGRKNFQVSNQQNNSLNENQVQQMIDIASQLISTHQGFYLQKRNKKDERSRTFSTVVIGLRAKYPSSLCTSAPQRCSSTGGTHPFTEAMSPSQRLSRPVPLS